MLMIMRNTTIADTRSGGAAQLAALRGTAKQASAAAERLRRTSKRGGRDDFCVTLKVFPLFASLYY